MAKLASNGTNVHVAILAEGITSREKKRDRESNFEKISSLKKSSETANRVVGVTDVILHDFPDNRMDGCELLDIVKCIETHIERIQPQIVFTHHLGDLNIDHQITHKAVITACRPQPGCPVKTLLFFEVPSSSEWQPSISSTVFLPAWFEDIATENSDGESFLSLKLKALSHYESEMRSWPHSRSLEAVNHLAKWRGASVGVEAAEAFQLARCIR